MRTDSLLLLGALLTAALVVLLGGVLREAEPAAGSAAPLAGGAAADRALSGFGLGDTAATVRRLEATVRVDPQDRRSLGLLGLAYLQRTRETGDVSYYSLAERALRGALAADAQDPIALSGLASLAASRHEFRESLRLARRAVAAAPYTARGYGLVGDALLELGRYDAGLPGVRPHGRDQAHARRLRPHRVRPGAERPAAGRHRGDGARARRSGPPGADRVDARRAREAPLRPRRARPRPGTRSAQRSRPSPATCRPSTGSRGSRRPAGDCRRRSGSSAARSRQRRSRISWRSSAICSPRLGGRERREKQFALVAAIDRLQAAGGVNADLETALFRADHGLRPAETVALARAARLAGPRSSATTP